jgi:hypothetical protein
MLKAYRVWPIHENAGAAVLPLPVLTGRGLG